MCPFVYNACVVIAWEDLDAVNRFNYTRWVAIVTPTDRPKSARNRYAM